MIHQRVLSVCICFLLIVLTRGSCGQTNDIDESMSLPLQFIAGKLNQRVNRGLNGVLLIRHKGKDVYHAAFGYRDRDAKEVLTVEHGFDIGSLVKPITAVGILRLEQDGKLSTDDTLEKYFAEIPEDKKNITIQQLLEHRGGLPDIFGGDYQVVSRDWFLEKLYGCKLISKPGSKKSYSNAGYTLLACIIEEVTGTSYEKYISENVLKPAGTTNIGYVLPGWKKENLAVGYRDQKRWGTPLDKKWANDGPSWNLRGNGGMLATAEDMCRWYEALIAEKIIDQEQLEKYYAFDAGKSKSTGSRAMGHAGGNGVFNTLQLTFIDIDFHMTIFTSSSTQQGEAVWRDFRKEVLSLARQSAGIKIP